MIRPLTRSHTVLPYRHSAVALIHVYLYTGTLLLVLGAECDAWFFLSFFFCFFAFFSLFSFSVHHVSSSPQSSPLLVFRSSLLLCSPVARPPSPSFLTIIRLFAHPVLRSSLLLFSFFFTVIRLFGYFPFAPPILRSSLFVFSFSTVIRLHGSFLFDLFRALPYFSFLFLLLFVFLVTFPSLLPFCALPYLFFPFLPLFVFMVTFYSIFSAPFPICFFSFSTVIRLHGCFSIRSFPRSFLFFLSVIRLLDCFPFLTLLYFSFPPSSICLPFLFSALLHFFLLTNAYKKVSRVNP